MGRIVEYMHPILLECLTTILEDVSLNPLRGQELTLWKTSGVQSFIVYDMTPSFDDPLWCLF